MWLINPDRERSQARPSQRSPEPEETQARGSALERYRMYGRFYERYWSRLFSLTQADLKRFSERMRASGEAMTLTDLARDVIAGRLRDGPQLASGPAPDGGMPNTMVRQWDPAASWQEGDRAIMVVPCPSPGRAYAPRVAEIIHVKDDRVVVGVDGVAASQVYALGPDAYAAENPTAGAEMLGVGQRFDEAAQTDFVLWRYGAHVVGRLLHALQVSRRFTELEGLWFHTGLMTRPAETAIACLAETMFEQSSGPLRIDDVISVLNLASSVPVATRFGLAEALSQRSDLFENVGTPSRPRWGLIGPPPRAFTVHNAVYDPETYEVLCAPRETLSPEIAKRLWRTGLLRAALEAPRSEARVDSAPAVDARPPEPPAKPRVRLLPRWLRPSRA